MPDLDGLELARVLRGSRRRPQLVFVSAYDSAAVDAFELHALDYLRKPVGRRRVEEAVERVAAAVEAGRAPADGRSPRGAGAGQRDDRRRQPRGGSTRLMPRTRSCTSSPTGTSSGS